MALDMATDMGIDMDKWMESHNGMDMYMVMIRIWFIMIIPVLLIDRCTVGRCVQIAFL